MTQSRADFRMVRKLAHRMFMHEAKIINGNGWKQTPEEWRELDEDCGKEAAKMLALPAVASLPRIQQPQKAFVLWLQV